MENSVLTGGGLFLRGGRSEAGPEEGLGLGEGTRRMAKAGPEAPQPALGPCGPRRGHGLSPDVRTPGVALGDERILALRSSLPSPPLRAVLGLAGVIPWGWPDRTARVRRLPDPLGADGNLRAIRGYPGAPFQGPGGDRLLAGEPAATVSHCGIQG